MAWHEPQGQASESAGSPCTPRSALRSRPRRERPRLVPKLSSSSRPGGYSIHSSGRAFVRAGALGLTVPVGFPTGMPRHRFDYASAAGARFGSKEKTPKERTEVSSYVREKGEWSYAKVSVTILRRLVGAFVRLLGPGERFDIGNGDRSLRGRGARSDSQCYRGRDEDRHYRKKQLGRAV
jgi:hypothetical protein